MDLFYIYGNYWQIRATEKEDDKQHPKEMRRAETDMRTIDFSYSSWRKEAAVQDRTGWRQVVVA